MTPQKDFFISYNKADRQWAEWIAWTLEEAGYFVVIQAWDFRPGGNFVLEMQRATVEAQKTIAVLSEDYLNSAFTQPEWAAAFAQDPTGVKGTLILVRVQSCHLSGMLTSIIYVDLLNLEAEEAQDTLLKALQERAKPPQKPQFPGSRERAIAESVVFPGQVQTLWMVPYPRNPQFTGREDVLQQLESVLLKDSMAALTQPQAIRGLGGIGKTQTAVEYAYRHRNDYDAVFWVRAELQEELMAGFGEIAKVLQLPQQDEQNQSLIIAAVKEWLKTHERWLLIVDNADDLTVAREFLPSSAQGHVLLTTRAAATGQIAQAVELKKMSHHDGALFLLRRAKRIADQGEWETATEADQRVALEIAQAMDGLPLALDQAGAFVEEMRLSLTEYLNLYRQEGAKLLAERGELATDDHPSVTVTFRLAYAKVQERSPAAADLLRVCAFLAPDDIPEEIFTAGASVLAEPLKTEAANASDFREVVKEARRFSLIERNSSTQTLNIHRLVQEVLRDEIESETRQDWLEQAIKAVNQVFPDPEFNHWSLCDRLLSHVIVLATFENLDSSELIEIGRLFNQAGIYLQARGLYLLAETFLARSLEITENQSGADPHNVAASLSNLAGLYTTQGRYSEAEPLHKRSLEIDERCYGTDHPEVATDLNNLAELYMNQGRYTEAETLYVKSLKIREQKLGVDHLNVATILNNLAELYRIRGRYTEAETLHMRSLEIKERKLGIDHPDVAISLNNLAILYKFQGRYSEVESSFLRSLEICEHQLGADHPNVATSLNNLAEFYRSRDRYSEAEPLYVRSLEIWERQLGKEHPNVATSLNNLALLYERQGCYSEAEPLYTKGLRILSQLSQQSGLNHPNLEANLTNFFSFVAQVKQEGRQAELSNHPATQAFLIQLQTDTNAG
jgi:tetratricopeptide (TPR) repeat protein